MPDHDIAAARREITDALLTALDRRHELLDAIVEAEDRPAALATIRETLATSCPSPGSPNSPAARSPANSKTSTPS